MQKSKRWVWKIHISPCSYQKQSWRKRRNISLVSHLKLLGSPKLEIKSLINISQFVLLQKQSCILIIKNGFVVIEIFPSNSTNGIQVPSPPFPSLFVAY